jgi:aminopeptidase N
MSGAATDYRNEITLKFYEIASSTDNPALMNKWFQVQALADLSDALPRVQALMQNPSFQANNAGRFRSLITSFTMNTRSFHTQAGYQFIGGIIRQMDRRAPPLAVELANKLCRWTHYDGVCAEWMKAELYQISLLRPISNSLLATVTKALPTEYKVSSTPLGRAKNKNEGKKRKDKKKKIKMKGKKGFS